MAQTEQLSLSWDAHQKSICSGLSILQQRGEFVDMTLAADGHHVKVHQMVLSLVSPYIKDLISTAQCPHPVIFLNNISYSTLCAILEYIYTGEVLMPKDQLSDLIAAGKALHIRGLKEMDDEKTANSITVANTSPPTTSASEKMKTLKVKKKIVLPRKEKETGPAPTCKIYLDETNSVHGDSATDKDLMMDTQDDSMEIAETSLDTTASLNTSNKAHDLTPEDTKRALFSRKVQYTSSNQGGLQIIYNRFIYQLRHIRKDGTRNWRCISYNKTRCAAILLTNVFHDVSARTSKHNHPFHDKNILQKLRSGIIYSKFEQAANRSECKKNQSDPK